MADRPTTGSSQRTSAIALTTVLVVIVAVMGLLLVQAFTGGEDEEQAARNPGPERSSAADQDAQVVEGCDAAPSVPDREAVQSFDQAPPERLAEGSSWTATLRTNCGDVVVELDGEAAPQAVSSFLFLARQGFYADSPCHRLTTEGLFVLQCGDPTGLGTGGPGYQFSVENAPPDGAYPRGTLAMARASSPDSNGSQFFVVYDETELPDPTGYTVFGEVTEGLDIVDRVAAAGVGGSLGQEAPRQPVSILDVTVERS